MKRKNNEKNTLNELPYEKFQERGASALTDKELLAIFIQTGIPGTDVLSLAEKVLDITQKYGRGIAGLHAVSIKELCTINGIGTVKAVKLKAICELAIRMSRSNQANSLSFSRPELIAEHFMEAMCNEVVEQVRVLLFDNKMHLSSDKVMTIGTINASLISAREILSYALQMQAVYFVILHNHPSGDPTPSGEDISVTEQLFMAGQLVGIAMADHIILGNHCYYSFREQQMRPFNLSE